MKKFSTAVVLTAFMLAMLMTGCPGGGDGTTKTLLVKVENADRVRIPDATVVLGDSNGVMIESKTTDANGEAIFSNPPANATVTAAATMSCLSSGYTYTEQHFEVQYDVNRATITITSSPLGCDSGSPINLNITNIPAGAAGYVLSYGDTLWSEQAISNTSNFTKLLAIGADDLQNDGKISVAVIILDASHQPLSYGLFADLTVVSDMTVDIAVNQVFTNSVQYQLNNIPSSAKTVMPAIWETRKGTEIGIGHDLSTTSTSTTVVVPYIPSFADAYNYSVFLDLDQNNNGATDSHIGMTGLGSTTPANQTFDVSQVPSIPTSLAITGNSTATPALVWTVTDSSAFMVNGYTHWQTGGAYIDLHFMASPARTSVPFPQLPDTLAAFRPTGLTNFAVYIFRSDVFTGYADYLTKIEQYENGTWTPPTSATSAYSSAWYSSTQTLAPALNKTVASSMKTKRTKLFGMLR